jgi:hypothetical protein
MGSDADRQMLVGIVQGMQWDKVPRGKCLRKSRLMHTSFKDNTVEEVVDHLIISSLSLSRTVAGKAD